MVDNTNFFRNRKSKLIIAFPNYNRKKETVVVGELIVIYLYTRHRFSCSSTIKAEQWLKKYDIKYQVLTPRNITRYHIKQMLRLSDSTDDILLSRSSGRKTWEKFEITEQTLEEMSLNSFIRLLERWPLLLKNLILFDDKRIVIGYHEEKIRTFISWNYRRIVRQEFLV